MFRFLLLSISLLFILSFVIIERDTPVPGPDHRPEYRGVCWVGGDSVAIHNITQIEDVGVNWISQTPFGWMTGYDVPEVRLNNTRAWWGERDDGLVHTAQLARSKGIKTMIKPHIWLRGREGKWRSDISMKTEKDWQSWFASYEKFILHYAILSEKHGIDMLCIGTELSETTRTHPQEWRNIIRKIRSVYHGKLTYAANWYKEYEHISFWDDLDVIGVQAYFPLSKRLNPNKKDLVYAWNKHKKNLDRVSKKYNKQVIFTEIGYKNTADSAKEPWTWPQHLSQSDIALSDETQRICYEALFESMWKESWFDGIFIWKWFHTTYKHTEFSSYQTERQERYRQRNNGQPSRRHLIYFTPQANTSLDVLSAYYLRR